MLYVKQGTTLSKVIYRDRARADAKKLYGGQGNDTLTTLRAQVTPSVKKK